MRSSLKLSTKLRYFRSGLYFMTFGTNDFVVPLFALGQTLEQVQSSISNISNAMIANTEVRHNPHSFSQESLGSNFGDLNYLWVGLQELYKQGARTLMVFNVPPLGCYPAFLASSRIRNMSKLDTYGCLATLNAAIEATNSLIRTGLQELQVKHPDATIIYADLYKVVQTLIRNGTSYGT